MSKRILVIDDDQDVMYSLSEGLKFYGYDTTGVTGGEEGFRDAIAQPFDIVIIDLRMPHLNGAETLRSLQLVNIDLKVVVHSGYVAEFEEELEDIHVDAVLEKPCTMNQIRQTIETL